MQLNAYLLFNGDCEAAFKFYEKCLGGKIDPLLRFSGTPAEKHTPPEWRDKVLHVRLVVGDQVLMGSDCPPDQFQPPKGFSVSLQVSDPAEAERLFHLLAENGKIGMPMEQTFWATRFGMLVDKFGIPWMINCPATAQRTA